MNAPSLRAERTAIAVFALARTLVCAYRAAHQSITVDEATTYLNYVKGPWSNVWGPYDPNNHVLFSVLARLSAGLFHVSELSLRLPTVIAGFFFVIGFYRILAITVDSRWIRWLATVAIGLQPLLMDFSVAARGYGLAIALLTWAVYLSIRGRDFWAGILAGLAMSAGFNLAYSVLGISLCPLLLGIGRWRARLRRTNSVIEPAAVVLLAICYPVIRQAQASQFYIGTPHLKDALYDFVAFGVRAVPGHGGLLGSGAMIRAIEHYLLPAIVLLIVITSVLALVRGGAGQRILAPTLSLVLLLAAIGAARKLLNMNYPEDRLTLPVYLFLALSWAIAVSMVANRPLRILNGVIALVLIAQFANQFHTRYFTVWQFDSGVRPVARWLRDNLRGKPDNSVAVSATWYQTPALEFYREVYHITALKPIERNDPVKLEGYDYYILNGDDRGRKAALTPGVTPLSYDDLSGIVFTR